MLSTCILGKCYKSIYPSQTSTHIQFTLYIFKIFIPYTKTNLHMPSIHKHKEQSLEKKMWLYIQTDDKLLLFNIEQKLEFKVIINYGYIICQKKLNPI